MVLFSNIVNQTTPDNSTVRPYFIKNNYIIFVLHCTYQINHHSQDTVENVMIENNILLSFQCFKHTI